MTAPTSLPIASPSTTPRNVRMAGFGLLGVAAVWPILPAHPPLVCPLRAMTGIPCPLCGMTRACVAIAHGDVIGALRFNPGVVLVVAAVILALARPATLLRV